MTKEELAFILEKHAKWLRGEEGGERADLGANLYVFSCNLRTGTHVPDDQKVVNAALIVRAVNTHDELVAALKAMRDAFEIHNPGGTTKAQGMALGAARAALAKLEAP